MGVCWQTTGDNSSKSKSVINNRLTSNLMISSSQNNNSSIHREKTPENNIQIKQADQPFYDTSFEESIKNFPDMPEIEPKILKGYGIKQMPGYKCDLKIDQLNQRRDAFWSSKNKSNIVKWKIIHQACIYDHINAEELLFKNNIRTLNGCINLCIDQEGKIFRVPNFCVNDPTFQMELLNNENSKKEKINIILNDVTTQIKKKISVFDNISGKELIDIFCEENNIDKEKYKIKLIFGGAIIKDDETLFQHKVKNDYVIQICKNEI